MALESLRDSMATVKTSKPPKDEGKHYIPFSKEEWAKLEAVAGELQPKDLKRMLMMIFEGDADFIIKKKS